MYNVCLPYLEQLVTALCVTKGKKKYKSNETPTVRGLAADNNKLYTETMIFLWNNHYNLNFIM